MRLDATVIEPLTRPTGVGPWCPVEVRRAQMIHRWDLLTFLHWSYDPDVLAPLLPDGPQVETFGGRAWVGLVPFAMLARPPHLPAAPWLSRFCETNVRTYVTAPDGTTGVWFLSLDAARLAPVVVARRHFHLPYYWSSMSLDVTGPVVSYRSRRRGPGAAGAGCQVVVDVGRPYDPDELGDLDHWLTARWRLYTREANGLGHQLAQHDPWPLCRAQVVHLDQDLLQAAGLPEPEGEPLVHWSPGVEVRIGPRRPVVTWGAVRPQAAGTP